MSAVKPKANNQGNKVKNNNKNSASSSTSTPKQNEKVKKLQDEITELKAKLNMYQYHMDPSKLEENVSLSEDSLVNMLRHENMELRTALAKFTSGITSKSSPAQNARHELDVDIGKNDKCELQEKQSEINKLEKDIKQLKNNNDDLKQKLFQYENRIKEEENNSKFESEAMEQQTETLIAEIESITIEKKEIENDCSSLRTKTAYELQKKIDEINEYKNKLTDAESSLCSNIQSLKREKESLEKLSKVVGVNIMNDNPNITDLSDENRPTKLSEKHCELYDNEWTDAYEEAENEFKTEEKGIAHLYKTLQDVSDFCKKKSVEHEENIRNSIMTLPNSSSARLKSAKIGAINQHQLREVRKSFAPMLVESVFQNYVHEKKLNFTKKENIRKFIKKCVEICWLMNSQNPPVIFDTSDVDGKSFDVDKFRTYTKTGKLVDYVVWPPMLLHKGGPMLCKGVAQGK